jgi:putative transcriptional regulator
MSTAFGSIKEGLTQAIAHAKSEEVKARIHCPKAIDVKAIRAQVGMSQTEFASSFGISIGTLRHWERGDREPHGPARVLLHIVSKQPKAVLSALTA